MGKNFITINSSELLYGYINHMLLDINFIRRIEDGKFETKNHIVYRVTDKKFKLEFTVSKENKKVEMIMLEETASSKKNYFLNIVDDIGIFSKQKILKKATNVDTYFDEDTNLCESIYVKF
jgi:hypothetical protein